MAITEAELSGRVVALRKKMREADLDALIVFSDEYRSGHSTYLTNYKPINVIEESPQVVFLVGADKSQNGVPRLEGHIDGREQPLIIPDHADDVRLGREGHGPDPATDHR